MKLLIDACVFFWLIVEPDKVSKLAHEVCEDPKNELFVSIATLWELQIKIQNGKLKLGVELREAVNSLKEQSGLQVLEIKETHIYLVKALPSIHKDPFDRMLISQAKTLNASIVTSDEKIRQYPVDVIW